MTTRKFRPTDAFVDESSRGQRYLMGCVLIEAKHLATARRSTADLVSDGKRIHFHQERDKTRRQFLDVFVTMPVRVVGVVCYRQHGVSEFRARDACVGALVRELQDRDVPRLTLESRQNDTDDQRTIAQCRLPEPTLMYDHRIGLHEPMLWLADGFTWALGSGGRWMTAIEAVVDKVIELRP
jgi:hypothetical protein